MAERIPKYDIDFNPDNENYFFLHLREKTDASLPVHSEPHSHNYYCISLLYEGRMSYVTDMANSEIEAPALLLLNIDQVHIHTPLKDCKVISTCFSFDFIQGQNKGLADYIESIFSQSHIHLSHESLAELDKYIQLIIFENTKGKVKDLEVIKCLLTAMLMRCAQLVDQSSKNAYIRKNLFTDFRILLNDHYKKNHQVKFYADKLNITTEVLNQIVKSACNKNPKQLIDERLLTEAKRLLHWTDITAREVTWELGFETDGYFNRFFKKHTGVTPKEYQRTVRTS